MNDKKNYEKYLEQLGWVKMKQPRKSDNTKYLVGEIDEVTTHSSVIISCAHHLTCRINDEIVDIWDCRGKTIGNYWIYKNCTLSPVKCSIQHTIQLIQCQKRSLFALFFGIAFIEVWALYMTKGMFLPRVTWRQS